MNSRFIDNGVVVNGNYKHFKGTIYRVYCIATGNNNELEVVYGCNDHRAWVKPLNEFLAEVDHYLYPNEEQKLEFEYVPAIKDEIHANIYGEYIMEGGSQIGMAEFVVVNYESEKPVLMRKQDASNTNCISLIEYLI